MHLNIGLRSLPDKFDKLKLLLAQIDNVKVPLARTNLWKRYFIPSAILILNARLGIFFSKNPRLLWKWVGGSRSHSEFFCVENLSKIPLNQYRYFGVVYRMHSVCIYIVKSC